MKLLFGLCYALSEAVFMPLYQIYGCRNFETGKIFRNEQ